MTRFRLELPSAKYKESFIVGQRERVRAGEFSEALLERIEKDFDGYIKRTLSEAHGENLPAGFVPQTILWLVDDDEYIGTLSIRHRLDEHLRLIGGHIGYAIRPTKRKQGYGTHILQLALPFVKKLGITRALITCDNTNVGSRKIIEKAGGVLENEVPNSGGGPNKLRYWIELT